MIFCERAAKIKELKVSFLTWHGPYANLKTVLKTLGLFPSDFLANRSDLRAGDLIS